MREVDPSPGALTYRGTVYPWQCDHMGHMNVMWYVGKFDEATWVLVASAGLTADYLKSNGRGMAAVEQQVSYKRELMAGDSISVRSQFLEVRDRSMRFRHVMTRDSDGIIVAETAITAVHMDTMIRRAVAFDDAVRQRLEASLQA